MATLIEEIADWVVSVRDTDIPERVKDKARLQQLSTIAAITASARHGIGHKLRDGLARWASPGGCTLLPAGEQVDLLSAVYGHSALSLALDYDDYLFAGHTGHSAVCVSLAVAEQKERSLGEALTAQIVANEIEGRLGAAIALGPHNGQTWSPIHLAGAAAAASRLLGSDVRQTAQALAISLYQPTWVLFPGFMGPDAKATTAATPSVTGVQAALLAAAGATGPVEILEHPQGFLQRFSFVPAPFFLSGFGRSWVTDTLACKIYPGCAYIDTTVDAVLALRQDYEEAAGKPLVPGDVLDVRVDATLLTVEMDLLSRTGGRFDPLNPVSINFSIPGNVALTLLNGRLTTVELSEDFLQHQAGRILSLSARVHLHHDWQLTLELVQALDRTLHLRQAVREIGWKRLLGARKQLQANYDHRLGLSPDDFRQYAMLLRKALGTLPRVIGSQRRKGAKKYFFSSSYDLGECALEQFTMPFAARVTMRTRDGRTMTRRQNIPYGGPGRDWEETRRLIGKKLGQETGIDLTGESLEAWLSHSEQTTVNIPVKKFLEKWVSS